jgi:hypothetical protein
LRLIIWDEIVTIHKNCIDAVDRTLWTLTGIEHPFGGKIVIFAGEFCQTLPVVKYNEFLPAYGTTLRSLRVWKNVMEYQLTENMRLASALAGPHMEENQVFAKALLRLGEGKRQKNDFRVVRLSGIKIELCTTLHQMNKKLTNFVYSELLSVSREDKEAAIEYLNGCCILAPFNCDVRQLNEEIMNKLPGDKTELKSIATPDPNGYNSLPEECLNAISLLGLPEHCLVLKTKMPVVLTRNLNIPGGL